LKKGYIVLKSVLAVFLFFTVLQATILPGLALTEDIEIDVMIIKKDPPIWEISDTLVDFPNGYYFGFVPNVMPLGSPYGYKYTYSTSPSCDFNIYVMDDVNMDDYIAYRSWDGKTLETRSSSGSGSYKFPRTEDWWWVFECDDYYGPYFTDLTVTLTVEKMTPIGLIIGISIGVVVVIAIVVGVVVSRKKKSSYIPPAQTPSTYSGYGSSPYGAKQTPAYTTPSAAPAANVQNLFNTANSEFQKGNVIQAMNLWEQILISTPDFYPSMCNLAVAHMSLGNTPRAVEYLNQALAIKPDYKPALDLLEMAKSKQGDATQVDDNPFA